MGFDHSMMRYCPVEVCTDNGTWSKPSISCALSECFTDARLYTGHRICTASGRHCQRWDRQDPHTHRFKKDAMFPENSVSRAEAFCRDPEGDKGKPWCLTTDPDKKWEYCDIQKCSDVHIWDGSCRGASIPKDDVDDRRTETDAKENKTHKDKAKQAALCMKNSANFNMKRGFRVSAIEFTHLTTRSFLECAAQCAKLLECRMLSYRVEDRYCLFYDNDNFGTVKSRAYKVGAKLCKKID